MCEVYGKLRGKRRTQMGLLAAGLLSFSNFLCIGLNAQMSGGVLSGTVMDASQAAIPRSVGKFDLVEMIAESMFVRGW